MVTLDPERQLKGKSITPYRHRAHGRSRLHGEPYLGRLGRVRHAFARLAYQASSSGAVPIRLTRASLTSGLSP